MNIEGIVLEVGAVREDSRNHTLQVDIAEIPRSVTAARKQGNLSLLILSTSIQMSRRAKSC